MVVAAPGDASGSASASARSGVAGLRAHLSLAVLHLQRDVLTLEAKLLEQRWERQRSAHVQEASWKNDTTPYELAHEAVPLQGTTLRERRLQREPSDLAIELNAGLSEPKSELDTAFYSPSCHDWTHEKLFTSREWTPYTSPRRPTLLSATRPRCPVLQKTDANRRDRSWRQ